LVKKISKQSSKKGKNIKNDSKNPKKQSIKSNSNSKIISNTPKFKKAIKTKVNPKNKMSIVVKRSSGRKDKSDTDKITQNASRSGVSFPVTKDIGKSIKKKIKKSTQSKSIGRTTITKQKPIQQQTQKKKSTQSKSIGRTTITKQKPIQQQTQKKKSTPLVITKQKSKIGSKTEPEKMIFTASQEKNLLQDEIKDKNQQDHNQSFSDNSPVGEEELIVTASQEKNLLQDEIKDKNQQDHNQSFSDNSPVGEEPSTYMTLEEKEPGMDIVTANKNKILFDPSSEKGDS